MHPYLTKLQRVVSRLAAVDQTEVCPLSRGIMSQPLSVPLQPGIRFFRPPYPHDQQRSLRSVCQPYSAGDHTGLPRSRHVTRLT